MGACVSGGRYEQQPENQEGQNTQIEQYAVQMRKEKREKEQLQEELHRQSIQIDSHKKAAVLGRQEKETLLRLIQTMALETDYHQLMQQIMEASYTLVDADMISLYSVHSESGECVCQVSKDKSLHGNRFKYGQGPVGIVAKTKRSLNIADAYSDERFDQSSDAKTGYQTLSILTIPVLADLENEVVAVIQAVHRKRVRETSQELAQKEEDKKKKREERPSFSENPTDDEPLSPLSARSASPLPEEEDPERPTSFTPQDQYALESLAASAGMILHKSLLYNKALFAQRTATALMKLVKMTAEEGSTLEDTLDKIAQMVHEALSADRVTVYMVDNVKERVWCVVIKDKNGGWWLPWGQGIAGWVAKNGQHVNIPDVYTDPRFDRSWDLKTHYRTKSMLCWPVKEKNGTTIAVIQVINKTQPEGQKDWQRTYNSKTIYETVPAPTPTAKSYSVDSQPTKRTKKVISFDKQDEEMLEAFGVEVRGLLRKHQTQARIWSSRMNVGEGTQSVDALLQQYSMRGEAPDSQSPPEVRQAPTPRTPGPGSDVFWPINGISEEVVVDLHTFDFDVWAYHPDDLERFAYKIFDELNVLTEFACPPKKLRNFVHEIRRKYHDNPFHNWHHGFAVMHFTYLILQKTEAASLLTNLELFGLLVSSLCHDVDHPGNTNTFEVACGTEIALLHNDFAVLENHHASETFRVLRKEDCNIFSECPVKTARALRKIIIGAIMATDMSNHIAECQKLDLKPEDHPFNNKTDAERQELVNVLIHTSDLSGQVLRLSVAKQWEERITKEFDKQAEEEEKRGLTVLPFMKNLSNPQTRAQNQVNFIDFVLIPWWKPFVKCFPGMQQCYVNLTSNRGYYFDIWKKDPAKEMKESKKLEATKEEKSTDSSSSSSSSSSLSSTTDSTDPSQKKRISVIIPTSSASAIQVTPNKSASSPNS